MAYGAGERKPSWRKVPESSKGLVIAERNEVHRSLIMKAVAADRDWETKNNTL